MKASMEKILLPKVIQNLNVGSIFSHTELDQAKLPQNPTETT